MSVLHFGDVAGVHGLQPVQHGISAAGVRIGQPVHIALQQKVGRQPGSVAQVGGPEEGQHQVGAGRHAVVAERLSEVFPNRLQPHSGGRIPDAADPENAVEQQPCRTVHGTLSFELQQAVGNGGNLAQVGKHIADSGAYRPGGDLAIAAHRRQEYELVEAVVEVIQVAVDRLQRIADLQGTQCGALKLVLLQMFAEAETLQGAGELRRIAVCLTGCRPQQNTKQRGHPQAIGFIARCHGRNPACRRHWCGTSCCPGGRRAGRFSDAGPSCRATTPGRHRQG